jgi:prepilin-type N-terminal cleavage/methylation domain-containing protein
MINRGFSALEMIISIFISAMLMTASLTIYQQISKGAQTIQKITSLDTQSIIVKDRLSIDLQGLCPLWFTTQLYEKLKAEPKDKDPVTTPTAQTGSKKSNNFLFAQTVNGQFDILTFISTNALQVYGDRQLRTVRVVYTLQPDKNNQNLFKLMRKEEDTISGDFDLEKLKSGKFEKIAEKITQCSIEYGFVKPEPKGSTNTKAPEFTFVSQWGGHQEQQKDDEKTPSLPDVIKLSFKARYLPEQEEKSYEILCTIPTCHATELQSFAQKRKNEAKASPAAKANQPAPTSPEPPQANPAAKQMPDDKASTILMTMHNNHGQPMPTTPFGVMT